MFIEGSDSELAYNPNDEQSHPENLEGVLWTRFVKRIGEERRVKVVDERLEILERSLKIHFESGKGVQSGSSKVEVAKVVLE